MAKISSGYRDVNTYGLNMSDRGSELSKRRLTICVVGSGGVGKSSITLRYLNEQLPEVFNITAVSLLFIVCVCVHNSQTK